MFLLTCLLRGMTKLLFNYHSFDLVSTHMPLARHDMIERQTLNELFVSTHMPLARHDIPEYNIYRYEHQFLLTCLLRGMTSSAADQLRTDQFLLTCLLRGMTPNGNSFRRNSGVSTHMPLARHDDDSIIYTNDALSFYSHASCEA